jgi:hypothetical protein
MSIKTEEVVLGLALMSPLDELLVAGASGGVGAITSPVQAPLSFMLGLGIATHGLGLWGKKK